MRARCIAPLLSLLAACLMPGLAAAMSPSALGTAVATGVSPRIDSVAAPLLAVQVGQADIDIAARELPRAANALSSAAPDGALQDWSGASAAEGGALSIPNPTLTFEGLSNADNFSVYGGRVLPPDVNGDVGPGHFVQSVNLLLRIFDKVGTPLTAPFQMSDLFAALGGPCATEDDGDPMVLYDHLADRWLLSQFALPNGTTSPPYHQCIAISQSGDPAGAYFVYDFIMPGSNLNDYAKFGVWPDAYYMTDNQFLNGGPFRGAGAFAFDRRKMLAGDPTAAFVYFDLFQLDPTIGGMLPADADGLTPPPLGRPNTFAYFTAGEFGDPQGDAIRLFDFVVDFATPASSTFVERSDSPVAVAAFDPTSLTGRADVPQPSPGVAVDAIADRLMHRLQYRNFGTHETLVTNHTVRAGTSPYKAAVRYYGLQRLLPGGSFTVPEQATYSPDALSRWMGSAAMDHQGNLAVGYSVSSSTVFPSIRYAGRLADDPANQLTQGEATLIAGSGVQTDPASRWGDYSAMSVDPVDDCTFWYTTEYYTAAGQASSQRGWQTRIGSFAFPGCTAPISGGLNVQVTNCATQAPLTGAAVATADGHFRASDAGGLAAFASINPGSYVVTASRSGFLPATDSVNVNGASTATLDLCLTPVPSATATATATLVPPSASPTATPTPAATCVTFRIGVCCSDVAGTNCGATVCTANSMCTTSPFLTCAGTSADDGRVNRANSSVYPLTSAITPDTTFAFSGTQRSRYPGPSFAVQNGLVRFNTGPTLPDTAVVSSAALTVQLTEAATSADGLSLTGDWYNWAPSVGTEDFSHTALSSAFSIPIAALVNGSNTLALSAAASNVSLTGYTYLRTHVSQLPADAAPSGINIAKIALFDHTTIPGPALQVCYALAPPPATSTPSPTPSATATASSTASATATSSPTSTATATAPPPPTFTPLPSLTPTATFTGLPPVATATPTATPTSSATQSSSATVSPTATAPPTSTATTSSTATSTATASPSATAPPTSTATASATAPLIPTSTATATAAPVETCVAFQLGVCCTDVSGTNCGSTVCTANAGCTGTAPFLTCAGASGDDGRLNRANATTYPPTTTIVADSTFAFTGTQRSRYTGPSFAVQNGLIRFNTGPTLPDDATVSSAALRVQLTEPPSSADALSLTGDWYNWAPAVGVEDFSHNALSTAFSVPISSLSVGSNTIALASVANVSLTGYTYLRTHVSQLVADAAPTGINLVKIALFDNTTLAGPALDVCYLTGPASPTVTPSATASGTATRTTTLTATVTLTPTSPPTATPTPIVPTATATDTSVIPTPTAIATATATATASPSLTPTPTATSVGSTSSTPSPTAGCVTFRTGVCCSDDSGTLCSALVCTNDAACTTAPFNTCAGASADDGTASRVSGVYPPSSAVIAGSGGSVGRTERSLGAGPTYTVQDVLLRFNTGATLPDTARVTSASLMLTLTGALQRNPEGRNIVGEWYDWGPAIGPEDFVELATPTAFSVPVSLSGGLPAIALSAVQPNVSVTDYTYLRLSLSNYSDDPAPLGPNLQEIALFDHSSLAGPALQVCYDFAPIVPTSTPTATIAPTPTATLGPGQTSVTFAIGVCCSNALGTDCEDRSPATDGVQYRNCNVDANCTNPFYAVCAGASGDDGFTQSESWPTYPPPFSQCVMNTGNMLALRTLASGTYRVQNGLLQFHTGAVLPDDAIIDSATLRLHVVSTSDRANNLRFQGEWYDWGGTCDAADYTTTSTASAFSVLMSSMSNTTEVDFPLAVPGNVQVTDGSDTRLRFHLSNLTNDAPPTGKNTMTVSAYEADLAIEPGPRLIVVYHRPAGPTPTPTTVPATPTATPTGSATCVVFRTGNCCTDASGVSCAYTTCSANSGCQVYPFLVCAGSSGDDGQVGRTASAVYPPTTTTAVNTNATNFDTQRSRASGTYSVQNGLMRFNTASLPNSATVVSATLIADLVAPPVSADGLSWTGEWYNWATIGSEDFSSSSAQTSFSLPINTLASGDNAIVLTAPVNVSLTGYTYLRTHVSQLAGDAAPTGTNRVSVAPFDNPTQPGPALQVCYTP